MKVDFTRLFTGALFGLFFVAMWFWTLALCLVAAGYGDLTIHDIRAWF